jgi:hypothetical protein
VEPIWQCTIAGLIDPVDPSALARLPVHPGAAPAYLIYLIHIKNVKRQPRVSGGTTRPPAGSRPTAMMAVSISTSL